MVARVPLLPHPCAPSCAVQADGFAYAIAGAKCTAFQVLATPVAMTPPATVEMAIADLQFACTFQYAFRQVGGWL